MYRAKKFLFSAVICFCLALLVPAAAPPNARVEKPAVSLDVRIPMRDGVTLSTNIYRPSEVGAFPVVLVRSPYGKGGADNRQALNFLKQGYAYVVQDCRGRFTSQGTWDPFLFETQDGKDCLVWITKQTWCNGKIAMSGGSYVGFTQWLAALNAPSSLKLIMPAVSPGDFYADCAYRGGVFRLSLCGVWGANMSAPPGTNPFTVNWKEALYALPLASFPEKAGWAVPYFSKWIRTPERKGFWLKATVTGRYEKIKAATVGLSGWYDIFPEALFNNLNGMLKQGGYHKVIMGPWAHGINRQKVGARDFGPQARINMGKLQFSLLDHFLKGGERPDYAPVRIFVMGKNMWRDEEGWPLARAEQVKYFFRSSGDAGTTFNGRLDTVQETGEAAVSDTFTYDPEDPTPTTGGGNLFPLYGIGPMDQSKVEKRSDVLVYTTGPLKEDLEVTGPVTVVLYASTTARDTDFTAKLVDVFPNGQAYNLCDGIIRARFRNGPHNPALIEPGTIHRYTIDAGITSNVFLKGHAIRIEISSSNFPRFARNLNTGGVIADEKQPVKAGQTVYHSKQHPTHVLLPVVRS